MAVPYFRLEATHEERAAVDRVLQSGWLTTGKECLSFEQEFAARIGGGVEAIAVSSNTAGMHLALEAAGIQPGDEVIVPTLTFTATAEVVRYLGADVRFVDVDEKTLCIDPARVEEAVTERTKAVMPVHYAGLAADLPSLKLLAEKYNFKVIEDAAHSFPATSRGRNIGALDTTASVFSFYANKTITTGEGGMIVTSDPAIAKRCRIMRLHGIDRDAFSRFTENFAQWRYDIVAPGFKYNMPDLAAALGREQLRFAEVMRQKRLRIAETYSSAFKDLPVTLPFHGQDETHAWHLYVIRINPDSGLARADLERIFHEHSIGYSVHYTPLHRMTYWRERYGLSDVGFPVASAHGDSCLSLPIFSSMRQDEVEEVIGAVLSAFKSYSGRG